jgi:hypothetical protein
MSKILFFSQYAFDEPILQYSGSSEHDVRTLTGYNAIVKYVELRTFELTIQFGSPEKIPDNYKTSFAKMLAA